MVCLKGFIQTRTTHDPLQGCKTGVDAWSECKTVVDTEMFEATFLQQHKSHSPALASKSSFSSTS